MQQKQIKTNTKLYGQLTINERHITTFNAIKTAIILQLSNILTAKAISILRTQMLAHLFFACIHQNRPKSSYKALWVILYKTGFYVFLKNILIL